MSRGYLAFIGSVLLPLGGVYFPLTLLGAVFFFFGVSGFVGQDRKLSKTFLVGLALAIMGGYWAKRVLDEEGLNLIYMLPTALVSTVGLYLQYLAYQRIGDEFNMQSLNLGGIFLVIGSATFWLYVGFLPLTVGTILIAYSFWRLRNA